MYIKNQLFLLLWFLIIQTTKSKPSIKDESSSEEISTFLFDYFNWKIDSNKFAYYVQGFNKHAGQLGNSSCEISLWCR